MIVKSNEVFTMFQLIEQQNHSKKKKNVEKKKKNLNSCASILLSGFYRPSRYFDAFVSNLLKMEYGTEN